MRESRLAIVCLALFAACGPHARHGDDDNNGDGGPPVCPACTDDKTGVINCDGTITQCAPDEGCSGGICMPGCAAAEANHSSVGCDYYAVDMDAAQGPPIDACYTVFIANTSQANVHPAIEYMGTSIDMSQFAKIPQGAGTTLQYGAYDPTAGLAPGQVAIVFLNYVLNIGNVTCPIAPATTTKVQVAGTGRGHAFHITTDLPVVAYQMLPYGGGAAAATGASLLLPTSSWHTSYIAVNADDATAPPIPIPMGPSIDFVGMEDGTTVTIKPKVAIIAGGGLPAGPAGTPYTFTVNKGEYVQFTQLAPLAGSPVVSDKPIGAFAGHQIMSIDRCCGDHGEQMLTPVRALGSEYVAAPHGDRKQGPDPRIYRIYGAVDGTALEWEPAGLGPATLNEGDRIEVRSLDPFVVRSQDSDHPFSMFTYMSGSGEAGQGGQGDADFVRLVPTLQYLFHYVFFTDPTYPFTTLTVVRHKKDGAFAEVSLECFGTVTGWQPVGATGEYEITWVKLVDSFNAVGQCNNGSHVMDSTAPFGVWVWGWGSETVPPPSGPTPTNTGWVSYGYPAGEGVLPINDVILE
jgi:hypothetical protein